MVQLTSYDLATSYELIINSKDKYLQEIIHKIKYDQININQNDLLSSFTFGSCSHMSYSFYYIWMLLGNSIHKLLTSYPSDYSNQMNVILKDINKFSNILTKQDLNIVLKYVIKQEHLVKFTDIYFSIKSVLSKEVVSTRTHRYIRSHLYDTDLVTMENIIISKITSFVTCLELTQYDWYERKNFVNKLNRYLGIFNVNYDYTLSVYKLLFLGILLCVSLIFCICIDYLLVFLIGPTAMIYFEQKPNYYNYKKLRKRII